MKLKLRPAVSSDFKAPDVEGKLRYLFGKIYAVKIGDEFALMAFRNTPLHHENFTIRFNAGEVYVIENESKYGTVMPEE